MCKTAMCGDVNHPENQRFKEWLFLLFYKRWKENSILFESVYESQKCITTSVNE